MISSAKVEEIRRLLEEGKLSQREISKQLQVSRGTVTSVAMDRRREPTPDDDELELGLGPPARCSTCGGLVYMPCVLCRARLEKYGPLGERSLLSAGVRRSVFGSRNERRSSVAQPSERGRGPREASSPQPERNARLPGR